MKKMKFSFCILLATAFGYSMHKVKLRFEDFEDFRLRSHSLKSPHSPKSPISPDSRKSPESPNGKESPKSPIDKHTTQEDFTTGNTSCR